MVSHVWLKHVVFCRFISWSEVFIVFLRRQTLLIQLKCFVFSAYNNSNNRECNQFLLRLARTYMPTMHRLCWTIAAYCHLLCYPHSVFFCIHPISSYWTETAQRYWPTLRRFRSLNLTTVYSLLYNIWKFKIYADNKNRFIALAS